MKASTPKQQAAIRYCEHWLYLDFDGDINNYDHCSEFLSLYLEEAKQQERELKAEYSAYIWNCD